MRIGLDIDNVISNLDKTILEEFIKEDKNKRNKGIINHHAEHIVKGMFDWTHEEVVDFFNKNMETLAAKLEVKEKAKYYMDKLLEDGHELYLISNRVYPDYNHPLETTVKWLKDNDINYTKLILSKDKDKSPECIENKIDIMFDDSVHNCEKLVRKGINCYLFETFFNRTPRGNLKTVASWDELYKLISNIKFSKIDKYNVIVDTDVYNETDDQFALAYLLKSKQKINIEAVTIAPYQNKSYPFSDSGIKRSYEEAKKVFELLGEDSTNLIFKGSTEYMTYGYDEENDAVNKIIEVALKNDKTYILAIGTPTNVALAIKHEPKIIDKIEVIWIGGHTLINNTNLNEANFKDLDAVKVLLDSKVKLTIIPCFGVASNLKVSLYDLDRLIKGKSELCDFLYDRFYDVVVNKHNLKRWTMWDISVIAYMINRDWFDTFLVSAPLINEDTSYKLTNNRHNVTFVNKIDSNAILDDMFKKIGDRK